jgi:PAS domain S-box-containing protein
MEVFYGISMAIGNSLDLDRMARDALFAYARKLQCKGGMLVRCAKMAEGHHPECNLIAAIPRLMTQPNDVTKLIAQTLEITSTGPSATLFPMDRGFIRHLLPLPGYGWLALDRHEKPIDAQLLRALEPLNQKLASFCIACESRESLKHSEISYRRVFENIQDVYAEIDFENGTIIEISPSVEGVLGFPREKLIGQNSRHFYVDNAERECLRERLLIDRKVNDYEIRMWHADGQSRTTAFTARIEWDAQGRHPRVIGTMRDITRRKQAESALVQARDRLEETVTTRTASLHEANLSLRQEIQERIEAEKNLKQTQAKLIQSEKFAAIGQLASGIAHEINTPIHYIGTHIRFMEDAWHALQPWIGQVQSFFPEMEASGLGAHAKKLRQFLYLMDFPYIQKSIPESLQHASEGIEQIAAIVNGMNLFSHGGNNEKSNNDLNAILENVIRLAANQWRNRFEIQKQLDPNLPEVQCVRHSIGQVFLNLLINSIHALEERAATEPHHAGVITLSSRIKGSHACVTFRDNGVGIAAEYLNRIFEPFFTTKAPGRGTGQGLAIAYSIVVGEHRGTLEVRSEKGQWTEFEVILPVDSFPEST